MVAGRPAAAAAAPGAAGARDAAGDLLHVLEDDEAGDLLHMLEDDEALAGVESFAVVAR